MEALGVPAGPVYSVVQLDDGSVKFSIKLDLSNLATAQAEGISLSVVESEAFLNQAAAETSAVHKAFKELESKHLIRIVDFSSHVIDKLENYNTHTLVVEGIGCLESV